ncbi:phospholipase D-like domain-containing protein [Bosea robiniae]|uniref:Phospholipase D n=1 Tax=Bosea robiniae TaxID=1036780 RepID=A0ABY0NZ13_9HYPH|nr:phospholipase D-like domain-containing protein [Bosea robiniae]SDG44135.1 PLD-like domain-containing protein [Bosea robiniae]
MLIAIPVYRLSCKVGIDRGRAWSIVEEMVLWATAAKPRSIAQLSAVSNLPPQIVVASIARMMRFRLVELTVKDNSAKFQTSAYGREIVESGRPLPFFPKRELRRVSFVIERATGSFFPSGQVRVRSEFALEQETDPDVRILVVEGGPPVSNEAMLAKLSQIAARGWEEQVALVDGRTASLRQEFMVIRVVDGVPRNVPEGASDALRAIIDDVASRTMPNTQIAIGYAGPAGEATPEFAAHRCHFEPSDLVIGGSNQLDCLRGMMARAHSRAVIHSTFLDHNRFKDLLPEIRMACARGVVFDLMWGAETIDEVETRNTAAAVEIAKTIRGDRDLAGKFRLHMTSTRSHAKLLLVDTAEGDWLAAVGSCNWLSSPFRSTEVTVVLRDPATVADVAVILQRLVGRRGLADDIANEMGILSRDLRRMPARSGPAEITLLVGNGHDSVMREVSGQARSRLVVGSNRLGSTARPGVVMQGEAAAQRAQVEVTLLYSIASGPLKNRHARKLAAEAATNGVRLVKTKTIPLHGKFVAADDDDLIITSLNWASASSDPDLPEGDVGVRIRLAGIARQTVEIIHTIHPELIQEEGDGESAPEPS